MFRAGSPKSSSAAISPGASRHADRRQIGACAQREWTVVGIFDAGGSGFDSEIWGDVDQLMQSFAAPLLVDGGAAGGRGTLRSFQGGHRHRSPACQ